MKKILVLTLLLVVLPYTFFPSNPDWFKLDQSIGRCYSAGAATTYFGLVLWGPCRDLDDYLFFIKQTKAAAQGNFSTPLSRYYTANQFLQLDTNSQVRYAQGLSDFAASVGVLCLGRRTGGEIVSRMITQGWRLQTDNLGDTASGVDLWLLGIVEDNMCRQDPAIQTLIKMRQETWRQLEQRQLQNQGLQQQKREYQ